MAGQCKSRLTRTVTWKLLTGIIMMPISHGVRADGPAAAVAAATAWRASGFDTEARPPGPGYWLRRNTGTKEHPPGPRDPRPDSACRLGAFTEVVWAFA